MTETETSPGDDLPEIPDFYGDLVRDGLITPDAKDTEDAGGVPELDTIETSMQVPNSRGYRAFLISGMLPQITKADRLYELWDKTENKHRLFNFRSCHTIAAFLRNKETGHVKIGSNSCKLRWCPICARTRKTILQEATAGWIKEKKKPKFITLTLAHSDEPLKNQIDRLYDSFKRLRLKPLWKKKIRGGVWFFQIKKSTNDERWHPHLHILAHGDYIDKFELSAIWKGITNDSKIVDVKKVTNAKSAAQYVARYASTPIDIMEVDEDDLLRIALAFKGRRICGTFGTAKGLQLSIMPPTDQAVWERLGTWDDIYESKEYNDTARIIWSCFISGQPCPIQPNDPPPDNPSVDIEKEIQKKVEQLLLFGNR